MMCMVRPGGGMLCIGILRFGFAGKLHKQSHLRGGDIRGAVSILSGTRNISAVPASDFFSDAHPAAVQ